MEPSPTHNDGTNYNDTAATQQQLSTMSIGIIILCVLFGFALVIVSLLLFMRRRRLQHNQQEAGEKSIAQQQEEQAQEANNNNNNNNDNTTSSQPSQPPILLHKQKEISGSPGGGGGGGEEEGKRRKRRFKQRIKERLPWHYSVSNKLNDEEERIDDLVFSAIQQHHPTPPSHPSHPYHRQHHHLHNYPYQHYNSNQLLPQQEENNNGIKTTQVGNESTMFEEGYSYTQSSTLRGTMTRASHCSSNIIPHDTTDPVLVSLARQHEFDRVGYYKNPNVVSSDRDEEQAMLQRLSMSSYHVW